MADDALPHLFAPFWSSKTGGLGMGLAVAKDIVISHGGEISAERNVGRGMTFQFTLPVATKDNNGALPSVT